MGDVNLEIKLNNIDERVIKIEESGGSGGDGYITSVSNDFNVLNKKLSLSNDVTTKLPKSVPTASDAGKVATVQSDGTVDWETPSASITEPTELEKGIIGGDEWVAQSYTKGATVIYNNKIYYCKADCSASNLPSEPDSNYWEETSLSTLKSSLESVKIYETTFKEGTFTGSGTVVSNTVNLPKGSYIIVGNLPAVVANATSNLAVKVGNNTVAIIKANEEYKPFCGAITIDNPADLYLNGANPINVKLDYVSYGYIKAIKVK